MRQRPRERQARRTFGSDTQPLCRLRAVDLNADLPSLCTGLNKHTHMLALAHAHCDAACKLWTRAAASLKSTRVHLDSLSFFSRVVCLFVVSTVDRGWNWRCLHALPVRQSSGTAELSEPSEEAHPISLTALFCLLLCVVFSGGSRVLRNRNKDREWARDEQQLAKIAVDHGAKSPLSLPPDPLPSEHTPRTIASFLQLYRPPLFAFSHPDRWVGISEDGRTKLVPRDELDVDKVEKRFESDLQRYHRASLNHIIDETLLLPMIAFPEYNFD